MRIRILASWIPAILIAASALTALARSGPGLEIAWFTVDSGGAASTSGEYRLVATIGQAEGTAVLAGSTYQLRNGFWAASPSNTPTSVPIESELPGVPKRLQLAAPAPNPFNPRTTLHFDLPRPGFVHFSIYDLSGRRVAVLVSEHLDAGSHQSVWNGLDSEGRAVASGVYLAVLRAASQQQVQRLALVK